MFRPFLLQSALSVENGLFRLNEAQIGLSQAISYTVRFRQSKTALFD